MKKILIEQHRCSVCGTPYQSITEIFVEKKPVCFDCFMKSGPYQSYFEEYIRRKKQDAYLS